MEKATDFLQQEMGQNVNRASRDRIPINLSKDEIQLYIKRFQIIDKDRKGYVSINDIRRSLKVSYHMNLGGCYFYQQITKFKIKICNFLTSTLRGKYICFSRSARRATMSYLAMT